MKNSQFIYLAVLTLLLLNIYGIVTDTSWIIELSEFFVFIPLILGFHRQLNFSNFNIPAFLGLSVFAALFNFFSEDKLLYLFSLFLSLVSYIFLYREALNHTKRETANKFMLTFFIFLLVTIACIIYNHLQQMETQLAGLLELIFYAVYYINLLVLTIVGLIYYLNSYSRKSVYFITLVMAQIFADVFRDMAAYYLFDATVLGIESFLRFGSAILVFQFFITPEKKLRLINMV